LALKNIFNNILRHTHGKDITLSHAPMSLNPPFPRSRYTPLLGFVIVQEGYAITTWASPRGI